MSSSIIEDFGHIAAELKRIEQEHKPKPEVVWPSYLWTGRPIVDPSDYVAPDFDPA